MEAQRGRTSEPGRASRPGRSLRYRLGGRPLAFVAGMCISSTVMALLPALPASAVTTAPTTTTTTTPPPAAAAKPSAAPSALLAPSPPKLPADAPTSSPFPATTTTIARPDRAPAIPAGAPGAISKPDAFTAFSRTITNPDGSVTSKVSAKPAYYQDAAGNWHDIDTTLVTKVDGSLGAKAAGPASARLAGIAGGATAIVPTSAGTITLAQRGQAPVKATVAANAARYAGALGTSDVIETLTTDGVEETVRLSSAAAPASYDDVFSLPAGIAARDGGPGVEFVDASGRVVATFGGGLARDAAGSMVPTTEQITATAGAALTVTVAVEARWLTDAARVFPVDVDPTLSVSTGDGSGSYDGYIDADYPTSTQGWTSNDLHVGNAGPAPGGSFGRSLLWFNLGSLAASGAQVTEAHLAVDTQHSWSCSTQGSVVLSGMGSHFDYNTTWNNQPGTDGAAPTTTTYSLGDTCGQIGYANLDATALAQRWANVGGEANNGIMLQGAYNGNESSNFGWKEFYSGEAGASVAPTLVINYNPPSPPSAPQNVTAHPGNAQATVTWTAPAFAGQPALDSFYVFYYVQTGPSTWTYVNTVGLAPSQYSTILTGLTNGANYVAYVYSHNANGFGGWNWTGVFTPAAPPSIPLNLVATAGNGSAAARWTAPVSNGGVAIDSYLIDAVDENNSSYVTATVCGTCTFGSVSGLTNGHLYVVAIFAHNGPGGYGPDPVSNYLYPGPTDPLVGAGDRSFFSQAGFALTDRTSATVNLGTGNLQVATTDLVLPAIGGSLPLGRVYNSMAPATGASTWFSTTFGYDWRFTQAPDVRLVPNADGSVSYDTASGNVAVFTPSGANFISPADLDVVLAKGGDGTYTLTVAAGADVLHFGADGNLLSDTDANGNAMTFAYPDGRRVTTITSTAGTAPGNTATIDYSGPAGRVAAISVTADGVTRTVYYTYDATGIVLTQAKDAAGNVTNYTYDSPGNLIQIAGPAPISQVTKFTYDVAHRVTSVDQVIPGFPDAVTHYAYSTVVVGGVTENVTTVTDPDNNPPSVLTFAPFGALVGAQDARQASVPVSAVVNWTNQVKVSSTYDPMAPSPAPAAMANVWGANGGQSLTKVTGATGAAASTIYNPGSGITSRLPLSTTDTMGAVTTYGYDAKGNLTSVTDPIHDQSGLGTTAMSYNADGTVAARWMPQNSPGQVLANATRYGYTNHQLTSVTPPTGNSLGATSASYDGNGRLRTSTSAKPMTSTFTYDAMDRVRTESHSDGSPTITYNYDVDGNLTSRVDGSGTTSYTYDAANRLLTKTTPTAAFAYAWDPAGNLSTATDPGNVVTTYHYDIVNRLDQVTEPSGRKDIFGYDIDGRPTDTWYNTVTSVTYSGNTVVAPTSFAVHAHATYDPGGQLTELKTTRASSNATVVSDLAYAYTVPQATACAGETPGLATSIRHSVKDLLAQNTPTTTYCYDADGRLTSASTSAGGPSYSYAFNYDSSRTAGPEGTHSVNSANQLTDTGFAYNSEGALTAGGTLSALAYNGLAQTTSITPTGGTAVPYAYAGAGQTERTTAGVTTDAFGLLGLTVETTAGATTNYVRGPGGGLVYEHTPTTGDFYYVFDGAGSVIALVDPNGVQRAAYSYDPYGDHATATAMNGTLPANPWRWEASYLDSTGLYKLGARYYDPHLGRFTQLDPVAGGSCNDYDYVCGDPVNGRDLGGTKNQPALPPELAGRCDPLSNSDYGELSSGLCTAYRTAQMSGNTLKDFYYQGYNSLQNPVDVTQRSAFNQAVSPYFEACAGGASTSAVSGAITGPGGAASSAAFGCAVGVVATAVKTHTKAPHRAVNGVATDLNWGNTGYSIGKVIGPRIPWAL